MAPGLSPDTSRLRPFTLGDWLVEPDACRVSRGETTLKLRPQLMDLLVCLARHAGTTVRKEEILAEVWQAQFIAESGLSRCVAELRQALQDDAQQPRIIETIPKRGYRLITPVAWLETPVPAPRAASSVSGSPDTGAADASQPPPGAAPKAPRRDRSPLRVGIAAGLALAVVIAVAIVMIARSRASVLTEKDVVLLAFENRTGDAVFDETIPLAVAIQLEQSPYLSLLSPARVQETLRMMQRPPETAVTRSIGMEICERVGGRALILTSIASLGRQYAIGLEAVQCGTGRMLARRQVTTDRKEQVLAGLERAVVEIRTAVGEPASSLEQYNVPIVEATTSSLDALRALRRGDLARDRGEAGQALDFYRAAVSLDPDFALAHSRRGRAARNRGTEDESRGAFERSFALRTRVTLPERLEIEADYHRFVTGEQAKIFSALELLRRTYPRRAWVRQFLASELVQVGRHEEALAEALEAERLDRNLPSALTAVARSYLCLNRVADARATAEKGIALGGIRPGLHLILFQAGLAENDTALVARERTWAAANADVASPFMFLVEADASMGRGRLQEALAFLRQYESWATASGHPEGASEARLGMARFEALAGLHARAVQRIDDELREDVSREVRIEALKVAAAAHDLDLAARLLDQVEAAGARTAVQPDAAFIRTYRSVIAASRGETDAALTQLAQLEPLDLGFLYEYIPLFERALVCESAGRWAPARTAFEKILANPNVGVERKLLPLAELGVARVLAREGDVEGSRRSYGRFFERWKDADPDLPVLEQARKEQQALGRTTAPPPR